MLFDVFSSQSPGENQRFLKSYLKDFGYGDVDLNELQPLHEHEKSFYYTTNSLYIKITPRAAAEISHLHYLMQKDFPFVLPTLFGTSAKQGILITQAIDNPCFMVKQADLLVEKKMSLQEFLRVEGKVLKEIQKVHQMEIGRAEPPFPDYSKFILNIYEQMKKEPIAPLLELPIVWEGETYPSIKVMAEEKSRHCQGSNLGHLIHGEFSHTNVGLHQNQIIIYDWEKMKQGDPCWDIAKWIKLFSPFYFVLKARCESSPDRGSLEIGNKLRINVSDVDFPFKKQIIEKVLLLFSESLRMSLDELKQRVYTALFLSNLHSLRAADIKFKQTVPLMLLCFLKNEQKIHSTQSLF